MLLHHHKHEKFYRHVMALNRIANKPVKGEKKWLHKWSFAGGELVLLSTASLLIILGPILILI